jgi:hypothetical protein
LRFNVTVLPFFGEFQMHKVIVAVVVGTTLSLTLAAQRPTEAEVEAVIKCGRGEAKCERPIIYPGGFYKPGLHFEVEILPPLGRIYLASREAKEKYLKFAREDVTEEMLAPVIVVRARWTNPDMSSNVNVRHIVILPRRRKDGAVQPTKMEDWNYEAKNLTGASFTRIGKAAYFNVSELPPGELDVVIVSDTQGEVRAAVDTKKRDKLDAWCGVKAGGLPPPR